jgi:hypothetical protein
LRLRQPLDYRQQNRLYLALGEIGRIERTLFMLDWIENANLRKECHAGLNKGEARHSSARAVFAHSQGRIHDRSESATISTLVVRMERDGFVQKEPSPRDKRASLLKATPHATTLMRRANQLMAVEASDMTHRLTEGEQLQLIALLERVLKNLSPED